MIVRDWRVAQPDVLAPLFAREIRRWRDQLAWDTEPIWTRVEHARRLGYLPGLLISDDMSRVRGWSFHLLHGETLQVGALVTDSANATRAWLDTLRRTPEAAAAQRCQCFGWFEAPGFWEGLREAGLDVQQYHYLLAETKVSALRTAARAWRDADSRGVASLLSAAYPGADETRPFASAGTPEAWKTYCEQMVDGDANGTFDPALTVVVPGEGDHLDAVALVTRLAPETAHIAQLAVHPAQHGRGIGRALLGDVLRRAHEQGCTVMTLLVNEQNQPARALYASAGFRQRATFVSATGALATSYVAQAFRPASSISLVKQA